MTRRTRSAHSAARFHACALTGMGALHFLKPEPFDGIVPTWLPGPARRWTLLSGVGELGTAALLALPATRRAGGAAAFALYLAVWPANLHHLRRTWAQGSAAERAVTAVRLPLQLPLLAQAVKIARDAR